MYSLVVQEPFEVYKFSSIQDAAKFLRIPVSTLKKHLELKRPFKKNLSVFLNVGRRIGSAKIISKESVQVFFCLTSDLKGLF